jgi:hypothetical protein
MKSFLFLSAIVACALIVVDVAHGQAAGAGAGGAAAGGSAQPGSGGVPAPGGQPNQMNQPGGMQNQLPLQNQPMRTQNQPLTGANVPGSNTPVLQNQPNTGLNARQSGGGNARQTDQNDPDRWRFSFYNGEWWYWMPGDYWVYYRDNNWTRYDPAMFQPYRYMTGYRGVNPQENQAVYYDERGRQYRRDYSPNLRSLRNPNVIPESREGARISGTIGGATGGDTSGRAGAEIGGAGTNR